MKTGAPGRLYAGAVLGALPGAAHAQHIPMALVVIAASPLLVLVLALVLGWLARSVRTAVRHAGLVVIWVVLFAVASYYVTNDYIIWTPVVLYVAHSVVILALLVIHAVKRIRGRRRPV